MDVKWPPVAIGLARPTLAARQIRVAGFGLVAIIVSQFGLSLGLDAVLQTTDYRAGARYAAALIPFGRLLWPAMLGIAIVAVLNKLVALADANPTLGSRCGEPGILLALGLVLLAPNASIAWLLLLVVLWHSVPSSEFSVRNNRIDEAKAHFFSGPVLAISLAVGIVLRLANLAQLGPSIDENFHLASAIDQGFDYSRASAVTATVRIASLVFRPESLDEYLFAARMPGALIGAATALPLFAVARRVHPRVGTIAAVVWLLHPLSIEMSRYVREYVYFAFASTLLLALGVELIERFRTSLLKSTSAVAALTMAMVAYAMFDGASTFRANAALATLALSLILIFPVSAASHSKIFRDNWPVVALVLGVLGGIFFLEGVRSGLLRFNLSQPGLRFYEFYASGTGVFDSHPNFVALVVGLAMLGFVQARRAGRAVLFGIAVSTAVAIYGLVYSWDRFDGPYYSFFLLPSVVVLLATALHSLVGLVEDGLARIGVVAGGQVVTAAVLVAVVPVAFGAPLTDEIFRTLRNPTPRYVLEQDPRPLFEYLRSLPDAPEVAISVPAFLVASRFSNEEPDSLIRYRYRHASRHVVLVNAIERYGTGVISIDQVRINRSLSLPREDFAVQAESTKSICVSYKGRPGDFHVWTWGYAPDDDCDDAIRLTDWLATTDRSGLLFTG